MDNQQTASQEAAGAQHAAAQWQPIETAPKDGTLVMLGARNGAWVGKYVPVYTSGYRPDNPWSSMLLNHDHMAERYTRPTHWMPLPAAPSTTPPKADAASPAPAQAVQPMIDADKLHREIMNLPMKRTRFALDLARELYAEGHQDARHAAAEMVSAAQRRKATDEEIREWADRHDLGIASLTDLRCAFEDAESLHLTFGGVNTDGGSAR